MPMSRLTTSVAAVAAGVLLLGAAGGTFAQWKESETVDGGTVTVGHLDMEVTPGTWFDTKGTPDDTSDDTELDAASFRIVPGDVIEYRATITPDLVGDNLEAELSSDLSTATGDLADFVTTESTLDGAPTQTLTPADNGTSFDAIVRVEMPYGEGTVTDPDGGEDTSLDLSSMEIALVQTPNP
ncbi:alternate-type signal peptide domain-containing protein [Janibacter sp. CX7]|uniref:alternate-type signal peptide domain-containing protein n=1 Tax=Janibacter sp. CX7 TaxID=2963431 RepID=UPI0020CE52CC|nr:alternate-type signal peptide domain-containing protein [Janibacter sp. CX7]UTT65081.1 alternate-type signal peptide domain-containing protein [Janibacter sp. CX7]